MSHGYCQTCGGHITCGDGGCGNCAGLLKPHDRACDQGFFSHCDECFDKIPVGTVPEYVRWNVKQIEELTHSIAETNAHIARLQRDNTTRKERMRVLTKELDKIGTGGKRE